MLTPKLLLVVAIVYVGIGEKECSYGGVTKKIKLDNNEGILTADFSIGTPAQKFKVIFDTEKTDFWIIGPDCTSDYCKARVPYDGSKSSTFRDKNKQATITYRDTTSLSGNVGSDVVQLGGLTIEDQDFVVVSSTNGVYPYPYDSLLGLAYYTDSDDKNKRLATPLENLVKQHSLKSKIFSIRLTATAGVLVLGGIEPRYYLGRITYVPLETKGYWGFNVSRTSIGDLPNPYVLRPSGAKIMIDAGINYLGVPQKDLDSIASYFGAYFNNSTQQNNVRCSYLKSSATFNLQIGRQTFRVPPGIFISVDKKTNICSLNVYAVPQDYYVFGNPFLQAFYTVFDAEKHRIGLAVNNPKFNPNY